MTTNEDDIESSLNKNLVTLLSGKTSVQDETISNSQSIYHFRFIALERRSQYINDLVCCILHLCVVLAKLFAQHNQRIQCPDLRSASPWLAYRRP